MNSLQQDLRDIITIPHYKFLDIKTMPKTERLSVSVEVKLRDKVIVLHSAKRTIAEVATDLNEQYAPYHPNEAMNEFKNDKLYS